VTYFAKVAWVILVHVRTMVMLQARKQLQTKLHLQNCISERDIKYLTAGQTATSGMFAMLSHATVSGRDMAATGAVSAIAIEREIHTYCFLVLLRRVGIVSVVRCYEEEI